MHSLILGVLDIYPPFLTLMCKYDVLVGITDIPGFTDLLLPPEISWGGDYTARPQYDFRNIDIFQYGSFYLFNGNPQIS